MYKIRLVISILFAIVRGTYFLQFSDKISEFERVDCHPDPVGNQNACENRNCIWDGSELDITGAPRCYYPPETGYKVITFSNKSHFFLEKIGTASPFGGDIKKLEIKVRYISERTLNVKIIDPQSKRFEPPVPLANHPYPYNCFDEVCDELFFQNFTKTGSKFFSFQIIRKTSAAKLFDTSLGGLVYADQFLQIATVLPSRHIYGFGENLHKTLKHNLTEFKTWPMFARDQAPDSTEETKANLYGVHPFYLCVEADGNAHGVFFFNSNAQEASLGPGLGSKGTLTYRSIGGVLDIYFFPGPKPEQVIQQYLTLIGRPTMPAYWALGFGLSRYGYKNLAVIKDVLDRNRKAGMPQDFQVFDIDYMDRNKDFTNDPVEFKGISEFVKTEIHDKGVKLVTMLDPAIDVHSFNYKPLARALKSNVFISWPNSTFVKNCVNETDPFFMCPLNKNYETTKDTDVMLGTVWPDHNTAFPDFFKPGTSTWWINEIQKFHDNIAAFDGLWIDMNEPSNFGTNIAHPWYFDDARHPNVGMLYCPENPLDDPPYETWAVYHHQPQINSSRLSSKTLCMIGSQGNGAYRHYDVHSLFGWSETIATLEAVYKATGKRGSLITRSTFPSSGKYGGHWLGDNTARWEDLQTSVIGIMEFNFFGIPYIGADVCGFFLNTTEELCLRWHQTGAFYPFYRNHNGLGNMKQDPAIWKAVLLASRQAARFRYHFLPYLYTLFYQAYTAGHTVVRPLFFEYPKDPVALEIDRQFMWGDGFLVTPVLDPGVYRVKAYFPQPDLWYSIYDFDYGERVTPGWVDLYAPTTTMIPVHVRGGRIFPRQAPELTTAEARKNPLELLIAPDLEGNAHGYLYWDDGETIVINTTKGFENFFYFSFDYQQENNASHLTITKHADGSSAGVKIPSFDIIEIFGSKGEPDWQSFRLDGKILTVSKVTSSYNPSKKVFHLKSSDFVQLQNLPVDKASVLSWTVVADK